VHLRETGSTNDRARALADAGAPHGTLVTASSQSAGRGRQGRRWTAPAGSSLLMSLLLRFGAPDDVWACVEDGGPGPAKNGETSHVGTAGESGGAPFPVAPAGFPPPSLLPLIAAVAVCDVVGEDALIKWPNDIVLARADGRADFRANDPPLAKLAGILVEGRPQAGWAVLGIGLNVAVQLDELPAELRTGAATLGHGRDAIEPTLERLLTALALRLAEPPERTLDAWRARDALRGRAVAWSSGRGRAQGIDAAGHLLVAPDGGGGPLALDAGEVHLTSAG
jgi:BirA family transcriptional regulator, biotin operon repressor / biotin---[acetyl-CoA-carboxylase] ligase